MFEDGGGGGGGMQTDTGQLTSAAQEAGTTAEALDTMLRNLMDRLEPLMTQWLGAAGLSFQNVRGEFEIEMGKLNRALYSIGEDMGLSSGDYQTTDDELRTNLESVGASDQQITRLLAGLEA